MTINIEWQDQNGNWHNYQTKQNQADAYRVAARRASSSKDTPTLTVMVMGRPVKASSNKGLEQDPVKHPRIMSKPCPTQGSAS